MDVFNEQIVAIKKDVITILLVAMIWIFAFMLCFLAVFSNLLVFLGAFRILAAFGIGYGAYKLTSIFNVEYEYIITNGIMDIDKITNKSSRKRMMTLNLEQVSRIERFEPSLIANIPNKSLLCASNRYDESYLLVCDNEGKDALYLVFAPNERMQKAILKFVPKFVGYNAFK